MTLDERLRLAKTKIALHGQVLPTGWEDQVEPVLWYAAYLDKGDLLDVEEYYRATKTD